MGVELYIIQWEGIIIVLFTNCQVYQNMRDIYDYYYYYRAYH